MVSIYETVGRAPGVWEKPNRDRTRLERDLGMRMLKASHHRSEHRPPLLALDESDKTLSRAEAKLIHGYRALQRRFLEKMTEQDFTFTVNGYSSAQVEWPGQAEDFARFDELMGFVLDENLSDADFRARVPEIMAVLDESVVFSRLQDTSMFANPATVQSPRNHIQEALLLIQTDHPELQPYRPLLRTFVLCHDLAKVIDPIDKYHGAGSAYIALEYCRQANLKAEEKGEPPLFSPEFIADLVYLCAHHHLFYELAQNLTQGALYANRRDYLAHLSKRGTQPFTFQQASLTSFNQRLLAVMSGRNESGEMNASGQVDLSSFEALFPRVAHEPALQAMLYAFTLADTGTNPNYEVHSFVNYYLYLMMRQGSERV